jgi:hypothetical protein
MLHSNVQGIVWLFIAWSLFGSGSAFFSGVSKILSCRQVVFSRVLFKATLFANLRCLEGIQFFFFFFGILARPGPPL